MYQVVQVPSFPCLGYNVATLAYYLITRKRTFQCPEILSGRLVNYPLGNNKTQDTFGYDLRHSLYVVGLAVSRQVGLAMFR